MRRRTLGAALLSGLLALVASAAAADPVTVLTDVQPGYGRIVFGWPAPVAHTSHLHDEVLTLTFARPVEADLSGLARDFFGYVSGAQVSDDGRTISLNLTKHYLFRSFEAGAQVTVDLLGAGAAAAPAPPGSDPLPAAPAAAPAVAVAVTPTPALPAGVPVRLGQHEGYGRLVFDWTQNVEYTAARDGNRVVIEFDRAESIDLSIFGRLGLTQVVGATAESVNGRTMVQVAVVDGARLRHFRSGTKVVVDILDPPAPAEPAAPEVAEAGDPAPEAPTPEMAEPPPPQPAGDAPPEVADVAAVPPSVLAPAPGPADVVAGDLGLRVTYSLPEEAPPQIVFVTSRPVALAAFMRAGYLWVVLDGVASSGGLAAIPEEFNEILFLAERVQNETATALRFRIADGVYPSIGLTGDGWTASLRPEPTVLAQPVELVRQNTADLGPVLILPANQAGSVVEVADPEVGDALQVVLVGIPGHGIGEERAFVQFRLLETLQGVAVQKLDDRVELVAFPNGVAITGTEALFLTPVPDGTVLGAAGVQGGDGARLPPPDTILKFADWAIGPGDRFGDSVREFQYGIGLLPPEERNPDRLRLAQYYLAHRFDTEALGILDVIAADDPEFGGQPVVLGMRGVALLSLGRLEAADEVLLDPRLDDDIEMAFWRGVLLAREKDWSNSREQFVKARNVGEAYPMEVRAAANIWKGQAAFQVEDIPMLDAVLTELDADALGGEIGARASLLRTQAFGLVEAVDEALALYDHVISLDIRPTTAEAKFMAANLLLDAGELTAAQAIADMEALRYAWRGGEFEFGLLESLGNLHTVNMDYNNALAELRQVVTVFPDRSKEAGVAQRMNQLFEDLFLGGIAEELAPVSALALYYDFRELTPVGDDGDEMVRRLADRLVSVDLLAQAADLLEYQVAFRLKGEERTLIAARLAVIYLLDRQHQKALDAIRGTRFRLADPNLLVERARLEAEALSGLGLHDEALALIKDDPSGPAQLLRSNIYWRAERWADNARTLDAYLGSRWESDDPLNNLHRTMVMQIAVSLALAEDEAGTQWLRDRYLSKMAETDAADAFDVVTHQVDLTTVAFREVASSVAQLDTLNSFMATYLNRLQSGGVEAIN